ncbi:MAG: hypothetical protein QNL78_00420 [Actinomycetes bacterium]
MLDIFNFVALQDGEDFIFHVSNRKKSSGILFDRDVGEENSYRRT